MVPQLPSDLGGSSYRDAHGCRAGHVPICIDPSVRDRLGQLLFKAEMIGVGYSEFLTWAIETKERELNSAASN